jgi:hypothetical protein
VDRVWGLLLLFLGAVLAALGVLVIPIALVGAVACVALLIGTSVWARLHRPATITPTRLDPAEDPARRREREALQSQARKVAQMFRAMASLNQIAETPGDVRLEWRTQYLKPLEDRRETYRGSWSAKLPDARSFVSPDSPVRPEWLEAIAREADVIVWQLDHEH